MVRRTNSAWFNWIDCADCGNPILVGFSDGMIYCPVCENYISGVI